MPRGIAAWILACMCGARWERQDQCQCQREGGLDHLGGTQGHFPAARKTLKDDSSLVPVLEKSGATHETFLRRYLDRGSEEIVMNHLGLAFTGDNPILPEAAVKAVQQSV